MNSCVHAPRFFKLRVYLLLTLVAVLSATPRPAKAFLGFGDISHDPILLAGMFGQTGAQLGQLVQMYYLLVDMKQRYGSLTNLKTWKKLLRNYAKRSLQNLARQVLWEVQQRGVRITEQTPTNPVLSAMITGRRKLGELERQFNRADALQVAYTKSQYNIYRRDQEMLKQQRAEELARSADKEDPAEGKVAAAESGKLYNTRSQQVEQEQAKKPTNDGIWALYQRNEEQAGTRGSTNPAGPSAPATPASTAGGSLSAAATPSGAAVIAGGIDPDQKRDEATSNGPAELKRNKDLLITGDSGKVDDSEFARVARAASGAGGLVSIDFKGNPELLDLKLGGKKVTEAQAGEPLDGSMDTQKMLVHAQETTAAGVLQEFDGATKWVSGAQEKLAESAETIDQAGAKGPEPYLAHMAAQNDTLIGIMAYDLRARRAKEEKEQTETKLRELRAVGQMLYQIEPVRAGTSSHVRSALKSE